VGGAVTAAGELAVAAVEGMAGGAGESNGEPTTGKRVTFSASAPTTKANVARPIAMRPIVASPRRPPPWPR
jgi:hypothetical protein